MGETSEQNRIILADHNFSLLLGSRSMRFFGSWELYDYAGHTNQNLFTSFDSLVSLNDRNYLVHPEDQQVLTEIMADVKPGRQVHVRFRVLSPEGKIQELHGVGHIGSLGENDQPYKQAFERSEELLNSILDNTTSSIMALKPLRNPLGVIGDLEYVFTNKQTLKSVNRTSLVGKHFLEEFPEAAFKTSLFEQYTSVIETGKPWSDVVHITFNGQDVWAHVNAVRWEDCCLVTYTDVTLQKKAERQISQDRILLQDIIDAPDIGIIVYKAVRNIKGEIIDFMHEFINRAGAAMLGEDFTGKQFMDQGKNTIAQMPRFIEALETRKRNSYTREADFRGRKVWFAITNTPLDSDRLVHTWEDITERKNTETETLAHKLARAPRSFLAAIVESSEDSIVTIDFNRIITSWNKGAERLYGYPAAEAIGKPLTMLTLPEDLQQLIVDVDRIMHSKKVKRYETVRVHKDGQKLELEIELSPVLNEAGDVMGVSTFARDISKRKRIEANLAFLAEVSKDLVDLVDISDTLNTLAEKMGKYFNLAKCRFVEVDDRHETGPLIYGWERNDIPKAAGPQHLKDFLPADFVNRYGAGETIVVRDVSTNPLTNEGQLAANGIGSFIAVPIVRQGVWVFWLGFYDNRVRDWRKDEIELANELTTRIWIRLEKARSEEALRKSEEKYRELFERIDQGFCIIEVIFDTHGKAVDYIFIETNPAFEKQTSLQQVIGKSMRELRPEMEPHWFATYGAIAKERRPMRFVQSASALDSRWYEVFAFPTDEPTKNRVAILFNDITKRKQSEQESKKLYHELQQLDEAKTSFFSNISHEFRTPLTLMLGPLRDLINAAPALSKLHVDKLELIQRNAQRLQKLVNTLLDFSRIEAGQRDAVFQPIDMVKFTTELAGNFRSLMEDAGLKFVIKTEDPKEPVYLNPAMYEKIVLNLLSNAFKFTVKGTVTVSVRVKKKKIELQVTDTGTGIHPAHLTKIFERFSRLENPNARAFEGTGIGLALVKELVEIHSGTIAVKSTLHKGTRFTVSFLRGKDHLPKDKIHESSAVRNHYEILPDYLEEMKGWVYENEESTSEEKKFSIKPLVLVADDNADMRAYLSTVLSAKFQVMRTATGKKALEIIKSGLIPDAVVTDVMMPDMDGFELLARLKNDDVFRKIPVIMLSARTDEETRIEGVRYGADDYLVKPFSSRELLARVDARIQIARLQYQLTNQLTAINEELERQVKLRTENIQALNLDLREKYYQLEGINKEFTNLTFVAGQDLQQPLERLGIYLKILSHETGLSAASHEVVEKMMGQTQAISGMLAALAMYSNISAQPVRPVITNMSERWLFVRESLNELIVRTGTSIEADVQDYLSCDALQINLLLTQLVQSAIASSAVDVKPELVIKGKIIPGNKIDHPRAVGERKYYELIVRYKSSRTDESDEKIFQLLNKHHQEIDSRGTGIGLAVSRKIVENHGGFMAVRNWRNNKFGFGCYFPVEGS